MQKPKRKRAGKFGNPRIAELGIATRFKPGNRANPGGRPKTRILAEMLASIGSEIEPKSGKTYFQIAAEALVCEAFAGNIQAFKEFADRVDGRSTQHVELSGTQGHPIAIASKAKFDDDPWVQEWKGATYERRVQMEQEMDDKILGYAAKIEARRKLPEAEKQYTARLREHREREAAGEKPEDIHADFLSRPPLGQPQKRLITG